MEIIHQTKLAIPEIKVIRFRRFNDHRGYFTETFNSTDFERNFDFLSNFKFEQINESFSFANTLRGLHYQTGMGKLVRLIYGKMIDFALDLRQGSPTYLHIIGYELQSTCDYCEWIWLPPDFAHGVWIQENSILEYLCTKTYNPKEESTISFFSKEIEWNKCDANIHNAFINIDLSCVNIKECDRLGLLSNH